MGRAKAPSSHCIGTGQPEPPPSVPPVRRTPQHTVAIDDELWQAAKRIAAKRHERVSDILRRAVFEYVEQHKALDD